ncbi:MAG: diacylglycerol kinase family protein [bacterium]
MNENFLKIKLILNPVAGGGRAKAAAIKIEEILDKADIPYSLDTTYRAGGGTILAKRAAEVGFDLIVGIGGDGTLNEIINGMAGSQVALGVVPAGFENNFARMLGLPIGNVEEAIDVFIDGRSRTIDIGKINHRYFLNGINIGLDAVVAKKMEDKKHRNFSINFKNTLKTIFGYKLPTVNVSIPGKNINAKIVSIAIGNGSCFGGGFYYTPEAELDDGFLDVCLIRGISKFRMLRNTYKVAKGKHTTLGYTTMFRTKEISVNSSENLPIAVDGEIFTGDRPYHIDILHSKLRVKSKI